MDNMIEEAFRELREAWFQHRLFQRSDKWVWEEGQEEKERLRYNEELKEIFDSHTQDIICGIDQPIAPRHGFDLLKEKQ